MQNSSGFCVYKQVQIIIFLHQYNYLNLPQKITQNSKVTDYIYRADGVKVRKVFGTETTDYLDGFRYTNSVSKFFPTTDGYFNMETGKYVYNYTDHLGKVRLSYAKNGAGLEIIEESNYYPSGFSEGNWNKGNPTFGVAYKDGGDKGRSKSNNAISKYVYNTWLKNNGANDGYVKI